MRRFIFLMIMMVTAVCVMADRYVYVIDDSDNSSVSGATVIGKSGVILGVTDDDGRIEVKDSKDFPVTVRCIGYEPVALSSENDTVMLRPSAYQLGEVLITPVDRPIRRVVCFAREYSSGITGTDTMQYYCEYMTEAFIVDGKVKGYRKSDARPVSKGIKRYARITMNGTDSVFRPKSDDDITDLSWFDFMAFLPDKRMNVPEAVREGAEADTIFGKYGPQFIFRRKNNLFIRTADVLSGHKNRRWSPFLFKLLGMTVDIDAASWSMTFADMGQKTVGIDEFVCGTYNIHLIGRGKWIRMIFNSKDPIEMDAYLEIYPVEISHCTIEEYKEMRDDFSRLPFQYPQDIQPLSPAVKRLVDRVEPANART